MLSSCPLDYRCFRKYIKLLCLYVISGHYMYIETSSGAANARAEMWSSWYYSTGQHCVQFFYHMLGDHIGSLTVLVSYSGSSLRYVKFYKQGNQNDTWIMGRVPITRKGWFRVSRFSTFRLFLYLFIVNCVTHVRVSKMVIFFFQIKTLPISFHEDTNLNCTPYDYCLFIGVLIPMYSLNNRIFFLQFLLACTRNLPFTNSIFTS